MNLRPEVLHFLALGPLPPSQATDAEIEQFEQALAQIEAPLTVAEAKALLSSFGPDDCFGLAWSLVHLIESAPVPVATGPLPESADDWVRLLWSRAEGS